MFPSVSRGVADRFTKLLRTRLRSQGSITSSAPSMGCLLFIVFVVLLLLWSPLAVLFLILLLFMVIAKSL